MHFNVQCFPTVKSLCLCLLQMIVDTEVNVPAADNSGKMAGMEDNSHMMTEGMSQVVTFAL